MAENLIINGENKRELYETLLHQLQSLTAGDVVANMANVAAALKQTFDFFWVGFYVVKEEISCLPRSRGLLPARASGTGKVYANSLEGCTNNRCPGRRAISGNIACSSDSRSESSYR